MNSYNLVEVSELKPSDNIAIICWNDPNNKSYVGLPLKVVLVDSPFVVVVVRPSGTKISINTLDCTLKKVSEEYVNALKD